MHLVLHNFQVVFLFLSFCHGSRMNAYAKLDNYQVLGSNTSDCEVRVIICGKSGLLKVQRARGIGSCHVRMTIFTER